MKHDKTSSRSRPWIYPYELDIDALLNISMMSPILPADVALFPAAMSPKAIQVEVLVRCITLYCLQTWFLITALVAQLVARMLNKP